MPIVINLDQQRSRGQEDRVAEWADTLNNGFGEALSRPFVRSAGDELQGVVARGELLPEIVIHAIEDGGWWVGIGIGPLDRLGPTARDSQGPAFWHAREAVEAAKKQSRPQPVAVAGEPPHLAAALDACLSALAFIVLRRSDEQKVSVRLRRAGLKNKDIAAELNVSPPAVSQRLRGAGADEEAGLRRLAVSLADQALDDE
jgi:hypothetical protein